MRRLLAVVIILLLPACGAVGGAGEPSDSAIQQAVAATATAVARPAGASAATPAGALAPAATPRPAGTAAPPAATATAVVEQVQPVLEEADLKRMDNDFAGALDDANRAVAMAPAYGETYNLRALVLVGLGRYDEALRDADKAVQLSPGFATIDTRAYVYLKLKRYAEALAEYERLGQTSVNAPTSYFFLLGRGLAYAGLGDTARARTDIEAGLQAAHDADDQGILPPDPEIIDLVTQGQAFIGGL